jgi:FRG domain
MLKTFQSVEVSSWDAIMDWYNEHILTGQQWIFRGQKRNDWGLVTSLERAIKDFDIRNEEVSELEFGLLRRFRRQCHHYITNLPEEHDTMEWLALMQHYGAPTRLLDWTLSLFVALYFAVEPAEEECAIWALQHEWVVEIVHNILPKEASEALEEDRNARKDRTFEMVFRRTPAVPLVCPIKPYRFNDRLIIQQGAFLCPGDVSLPFEDNMEAVLFQSDSPDKLIKFTIANDSTLRQKIIRHLHHMNMNTATLFPGLVGFAQSLRTLLLFPEILRP